MAYKVGNKVRIKNLDWYNNNKDEDGDVPDNRMDTLFLRENDWCLGKEFIIKEVYNYNDGCIYELYGIKGDFTDYMIDCLIKN